MRRSVLAVIFLAACSGASDVDSAWVELAPMEVARSEHPAVLLDEEIIVVGGLIERGPGRTGVTASVEAYDPADDTWGAIPDLPASRHHLMAAVVDGWLFAIGGFSESGFDAVSTVWELVDGIWEDRAPLPVPIGAAAAVTLEDVVYVIGGTPAGGLYRYDPGNDAWASLRPPSRHREHLAAVVFAEEVWALAGRWQGEMFDSTEIYDPETDSWRDGPGLNEARSGFGATVAGETIVVAGGEVFNPDQALVSIEVMREGAWEMADALPFGLHGNPLVFVSGALYLPGGSTRAGGVENPGTMLSLTTG
ncbi:MAG: Kelch repeat-containing protein [Acidimicrobiia bacterium]